MIKAFRLIKGKQPSRTPTLCAACAVGAVQKRKSRRETPPRTVRIDHVWRIFSRRFERMRFLAPLAKCGLDELVVQQASILFLCSAVAACIETVTACGAFYLSSHAGAASTPSTPKTPRSETEA